VEKSFVAQEGIPAVCILLALLVIPLLFVSSRTTKAGFSDFLCPFCTIDRVLSVFLLMSVDLQLLADLFPNAYLFLVL